MGELIERPLPETPLEFNGERMTSTFKGQTAIEHWHRYLVARELVRGQDVLDIASGEGYGSALLAQTAKSVVGVDLSAEAVAHARSSYVKSNLRYLEGDALTIPLQTASVDAVVSFETLEHFFDHSRFFKEIKRILRPDGFLLISTPDRDNYMTSSVAPNPFHKLELTMHEFLTSLRSHFSVVSCQGQRVLLGAAMVTAAGNSRPTLCFERRGATHFESSVGMSRGRYLVALASNNLALSMPESIFIDSDQLFDFDGEELERHHAESRSRATELARLEQENAQLKPLVDTMRGELSVVGGTLAAAHKDNARLQSAIDEQRAEAAKARQELDKTRAEAATARQSQLTAQEKNAKLQSALDTIENRLRKARHDCLLLQSALDEQASSLVLAREEKAALQSRLTQRDEAFATVSRERDHLNQVVAAVFSSTSWKLSTPIRIAGKLLGRG